MKNKGSNHHRRITLYWPQANNGEVEKFDDAIENDKIRNTR